VITGTTSTTTEFYRKAPKDALVATTNLTSTMVDPDEAAKNEHWWKDERYAIYDLSPNSATAFPAHDEKLELAKAPEYYKMRGYAYSGGGRRITRV